MPSRFITSRIVRSLMPRRRAASGIVRRGLSDSSRSKVKSSGLVPGRVISRLRPRVATGSDRPGAPPAPVARAPAPRSCQFFPSKPLLQTPCLALGFRFFFAAQPTPCATPRDATVGSGASCPMRTQNAHSRSAAATSASSAFTLRARPSSPAAPHPTSLRLPQALHYQPEGRCHDQQERPQATKAGSEGAMMPSKSAKQARTMRAAAHNKSFAKRMGIPQSVAREFVEADKRKSEGRKKKRKGGGY